jgi:hypothetical protein
VLVAAFAGLFLGVFVAFVRISIRNAASSSEAGAQMAKLKEAWRIKRA